jgi:hypothetical protein
MTAQEAFDAARKCGFNDLATVLAICRRHRDSCVIGGLAVFSMDTDIVIAAARLPAVRAGQRHRLSKRKQDESDLIRLAEDYPEVRPLLPEELRRQMPGG